MYFAIGCQFLILYLTYLALCVLSLIYIISSYFLILVLSSYICKNKIYESTCDEGMIHIWRAILGALISSFMRFIGTFTKISSMSETIFMPSFGTFYTFWCRSWFWSSHMSIQLKGYKILYDHLTHTVDLITDKLILSLQVGVISPCSLPNHTYDIDIKMIVSINRQVLYALINKNYYYLDCLTFLNPVYFATTEGVENNF